MAILGLSLSVSGVVSADPLTDLVNSSQAVVDQLNLGYKTVAGLQYNANLGYMSDGTMADAAKISEAQRIAYNDALSAMADMEFYTAQDFLMDQGEIAIANMETAINIFWDAQSKSNNKILIVGLGSVGLLTAFFFKINGYRNI